MKIILKKLKLSNFKGLNLDLNFGPERNLITGDNRTGKTTVFDAMIWLLFGKDSLGRVDFDIKTIVNGEIMQNAEHSVIGWFEIDEKQIAFHRIFKEKWTKKRGQTDRIFEGHETLFYIDDEKLKKSDYEKRINDLFPIENFKIVTDPRYFASLHWENRRKTLIDLADISQDFYNGLIDRFELADLIGDKTVEIMKKIVVERRRKINEDLKLIPAKIEENERLITTASDTNRDIGRIVARDRVVAAEKALESVQSAIADFEAGDKSEDIEKLKILNQRLFKIQTQHNQDIFSHQNLVNEKNQKIKALEKDLIDIEASIEGFEYELAAKREEYEYIQNQKFVDAPHPCPYYSEDCPFLGIEIPEHARENAEQKFNIQISEAMEKVREEGHLIKSKKEELGNRAKTIKHDLSLLKQKIESEPPESETEEIKAIKNEIEALKILSQKTESIPMKLLNDFEAAKATLINAQNLEATIKQAENIRLRIDELKRERDKLTQQFQETEKNLNNIDKYEEAVAIEIENRINLMFEIVGFRMFKNLINGGLEPCCDITVNGVGYHSGLNNEGQINGGLDIINTLSDKIGLYAPVFIDNAEAVNKILPMKTQVIEIRVAEGPLQIK